jgi:hypothetical protein
MGVPAKWDGIQLAGDADGLAGGLRCQYLRFALGASALEVLIVHICAETCARHSRASFDSVRPGSW